MITDELLLDTYGWSPRFVAFINGNAPEIWPKLNATHRARIDRAGKEYNDAIDEVLGEELCIAWEAMLKLTRA